MIDRKRRSFSITDFIDAATFYAPRRFAVSASSAKTGPEDFYEACCLPGKLFAGMMIANGDRDIANNHTRGGR